MYKNIFQFRKIILVAEQTDFVLDNVQVLKYA